MTAEKDHELVALAKQLPDAEVDEQRSRTARASLLTAASADRSARGLSKRWLWGAAPVLAAAAALLLWWPTSPGVPETRTADVKTKRRANIQSSQGAHFVHTENAGDEVVRLTAGRISVQVTTLNKGQRLRVVAGNAVVDVRGATLDVEVRDDRLREVVVRTGVVEVRPIDRAAVMLTAGERWIADDLVAHAATKESPVAEVLVPAPVKTRPRRRARLSAEVQPQFASRVESQPDASQEKELPEPTVETVAETAATDFELMFADAWQAIVAGQYEPAIIKLEQTIALAPNGPLSEDARYWLAIAQARSGKTVAARRSMAQFLTKHSGSSRAGEVSAMLGWLFVDVGNHEAAGIRFEAALEDANPAVRRSAKSGLDVIQK